MTPANLSPLKKSTGVTVLNSYSRKKSRAASYSPDLVNAPARVLLIRYAFDSCPNGFDIGKHEFLRILCVVAEQHDDRVHGMSWDIYSEIYNRVVSF